jgi:tetratricopeptide (TPR) repeat protein
LSPFDPWRNSAFFALSLAHFHRGHFEAAASNARKAVNAAPGFSLSYVSLAAALSRLGQADEARAAAAQAVELQPQLRFSRWAAGANFAPSLAASMGEALRQTGLPV